jgi:HEAT repeat protein
MAEGGSPLLARVRRLLESEPEAATPTAPKRLAAVLLVALTAIFAPAIDAAPWRTAATGPRSSADPATLDESSDESSDRESIPPQVVEVIRVEQPGALAERMSAARSQAGASGARAYWLGYVFEGNAGVGEEIAMDTGPGDGFWYGGGPAVEGVLGVSSQVGPSGSGDVIVLVQEAPGGARPRVVRMSVRTPGLGVDLQGRPVYWLGRASAAESLDWADALFGDTRQEVSIRESALEVIARHPLPRAREILTNVATRDDTPAMRVEAVEELAYQPADQTVDLLAELAASDRDPNVRQEAAETLGEVVNPRAVEALQELIQSSRDVDTRAEALEALAQQSDTTLAIVLLEMALNDPDLDLRLEAVEGMEELLPEVSVPLLGQVLQRSTDRAVRIQVIETLGEIGTEAAVSALDGLLNESDLEVAIQVVETIGELPSDFAEPRLVRIVRSHPIQEVRHEALEQLADMGGALTGELLLEMALAPGNFELSEQAVEGMEELPPDEAVGPLTRVVFESQSLEVKVRATESLGELGTSAAVSALDRIVREIQTESVILQAVDSLGEIESSAARAILSRLATEHPSPAVRREARDQLRGELSN